MGPKVVMARPGLIHLTYLEGQIGLLPILKRHSAAKVIGTSHQPADSWKGNDRKLQMLGELDGLIGGRD